MANSDKDKLIESQEPIVPEYTGRLDLRVFTEQLNIFSQPPAELLNTRVIVDIDPYSDINP